jgi:hypothetical protein
MNHPNLANIKWLVAGPNNCPAGSIVSWSLCRFYVIRRHMACRLLGSRWTLEKGYL